MIIKIGAVCGISCKQLLIFMESIFHIRYFFHFDENSYIITKKKIELTKML
jgi:hypothetical protein